MEGDSVLLYAQMVRGGVTKAAALKLLPASAWLCAKDGHLPSSTTLRRIASPIFRDDLIGLEFVEGRLQAVVIECRNFARKTPREFRASWDGLRLRVSQQLREPGRGKELPSEGTDQRCRWTRGPVAIEGLAASAGRRKRLRLTVQVPIAGAASPSHSLEDLFAA